MGLFGFTGFNSFYYISAHHTYAINLGIVQATMPAFIVVISMIWLKTKISSNVYIGSNSTILPVKICSNVVIGAGSVVTKNIIKPGKYAGNPAKKIK